MHAAQLADAHIPHRSPKPRRSTIRPQPKDTIATYIPVFLSYAVKAALFVALPLAAVAISLTPSLEDARAGAAYTIAWAAWIVLMLCALLIAAGSVRLLVRELPGELACYRRALTGSHAPATDSGRGQDAEEPDAPTPAGGA